MATIKIQRPKEYIGILRDYQIYIDGKKVGAIAIGETRDFDTTIGRHKILAKIDWGTSREITIDINDNDTKSFKVSGFKNSYWIMPISLGIIVLNFILKHTLNIDYGKYINLPMTLLIIYYMTIGRKRYLTITEI